MFITFDIDGLQAEAVYSPAVRPTRRGHPDNWTEGDDEEIEILSLGGVAPDRSPRRWRRRVARAKGRRNAVRVPELPATSDIERAVRIEYQERRLDAQLARLDLD